LSSTRADGRLRKVAAAVVNWNDLQSNGSMLTRPVVVADAIWTLAKAGIRSATSASHRRDAPYHARTRAALDFFRNRWRAYPMPVPNGDRGAASSVAVGQ